MSKKRRDTRGEIGSNVIKRRLLETERNERWGWLDPALSLSLSPSSSSFWSRARNGVTFIKAENQICCRQLLCHYSRLLCSALQGLFGKRTEGKELRTRRKKTFPEWMLNFSKATLESAISETKGGSSFHLMSQILAHFFECFILRSFSCLTCS